MITPFGSFGTYVCGCVVGRVGVRACEMSTLVLVCVCIRAMERWGRDCLALTTLAETLKNTYRECLEATGELQSVQGFIGRLFGHQQHLLGQNERDENVLIFLGRAQLCDKARCPALHKLVFQHRRISGNHALAPAGLCRGGRGILELCQCV